MKATPKAAWLLKAAICVEHCCGKSEKSGGGLLRHHAETFCHIVVCCRNEFEVPSSLIRCNVDSIGDGRLDDPSCLVSQRPFLALEPQVDRGRVHDRV